DPPPPEELTDDAVEGSPAVRERVVRARQIQEGRLGPGRANSDMTPSELRHHCKLDAAPAHALEAGHRQLALSARGWDRGVRLARTMADLEGEERIAVGHIQEAVSRRRRSES